MYKETFKPNSEKLMNACLPDYTFRERKEKE